MNGGRTAYLNETDLVLFLTDFIKRHWDKNNSYLLERVYANLEPRMPGVAVHPAIKQRAIDFARTCLGDKAYQEACEETFSPSPPVALRITFSGIGDTVTAEVGYCACPQRFTKHLNWEESDNA